MITPVARQVSVVAASQLAAISMGGSLGYPCVLLQQFQSNETTIHTDFDTLTWIASMHGIAGIPSTLMPTIMQMIGRKYTFIGSCVLLLIGWILAGVAMDAYVVLLSSAIYGLASNCITIINFVAVSEMIAPKYRSTAMFSLNISQTVGVSIAIYLGTFINWKTIAWMMCVPLFIAIMVVFIWPESPSWLAYKGKFEESEQAFVCLRGTDDEAMKELNALIAAQKESKRIISKKTKLLEMYQEMKKKDLYLPSLYISLILLNYYICGSMALYIYSRDIIEKVTGDTKIAVTVYVLTFCLFTVASFVSAVLIKYFKIKTVLSTSLGSIACLIICSLIVYLQEIGLIEKKSLLFVYFFLAFVMFNNSGFAPASFSLAIELMPVKHRGIGGALFNILTSVLFVITVKALPYLILFISLSWTFLICAACSTICTILIWIYVPETKYRTLQEIEDYYNYGKFVKPRGLEDLEVNIAIVNSKNSV